MPRFSKTVGSPEMLVDETSSLKARAAELEDRAKDALRQLEAGTASAQIEIRALLLAKEQLTALNARKSDALDSLRLENSGLLKNCEALMAKLQQADDRAQDVGQQFALVLDLLGFDDADVQVVFATTSDLLQAIRAKFLKAVEVAGPRFADHIPQILHVIQACEKALDANGLLQDTYHSGLSSMLADGDRRELPRPNERIRESLDVFQKLNECLAS